ncbi:unnamed protein product [Symbiodinium sp. KB8]|nr:unnamed protein product [Symbiodinium sp. KB8]
MLRAVERASRVDTEAKQKVTAFLSGQSSAADPGYVVGMLSEIKDTAMEDIKVENETEDTSVEAYGEVKTAKKTEISSLLNQFERKKSCSQKASDWEARKAARAEEQLALKETIKILNDDKSLDLFRSRSAALIQLSSSREKSRHDALSLISAAKEKDAGSHPELNFLALALSGKKADFGKVVDKIEGMVELLANESADDASKQAYCKKEFREVAAKSKSLDSKIKSLTASVKEKKSAIAKLAGDITALQAGVKSLDESVAKAGENRKAEHIEYQESMSSNSASLDLLTLARDRMNKVYNPTMVTETTTKSPYALSFFQQTSRKVQQPPPTFEGAYEKKGEESNGVLKMIDTLSSDIEKEMAVAKTEEEDAQEDYQETIADAAKKREADMAFAASKAQDKADLEGDLNDDKKEKAGTTQESAAAAKYTSELHSECDWLLEHFDLREQARTEEKAWLLMPWRRKGQMTRAARRMLSPSLPTWQRVCRMQPKLQTLLRCLPDVSLSPEVDCLVTMPAYFTSISQMVADASGDVFNDDHPTIPCNQHLVGRGGRGRKDENGRSQEYSKKVGLDKECEDAAKVCVRDALGRVGSSVKLATDLAPILAPTLARTPRLAGMGTRRSAEGLLRSCFTEVVMCRGARTETYKIRVAW